MGIFLYLMARVLCALLLGLYLSLVAALLYEDAAATAFGSAMAVTGVLALVAFRFSRRRARVLSLPAGFCAVVVIWPLLGFLGGLPYFFAGMLSLPDAFFEGLSFFTTTGFSLLEGAPLSPSLAFWQSAMGWGGGLCFLILLVTILPQVSGCFGITLAARQMAYFSPAWKQMQESLLQGACLYFALTALSSVFFLLAGEDVFSAGNRAMRLISTTGGAPSALSYRSTGTELAAFFSMMLAGGNFVLYVKAFERRDWRLLFFDTELRFFWKAVLALGALLALHIAVTGEESLLPALRHALFQSASFLTTTGVMPKDFPGWSEFAFTLFLLAICAGACIGSPGGGLKMMRILVLFRLSLGEMRRMLHPKMVLTLHLDGKAIEGKIVQRIMSFFFFYALTLMAGALLFSFSVDAPKEAIYLSAACLSSTGAEAMLPHFSVGDLDAWGKSVACFLMMLGRMEVFSFLVLLDFVWNRGRASW